MTSTGWQAELAGSDLPGDWAELFAKLTGNTAQAISQFNDPKTGQTRIAALKDGKVTALLFVAKTPVVLARQIAVQTIGTETSALHALAGVPSSDMPDQGAIVCSCESVGKNTILEAIANGADTVDAIGKATCAGTNCGSCRPELKAMLAAIPTKIAAE